MKKLIEFIIDLGKSSFWGEITIKFKAGVPILVSKQEQIKVDDDTPLWK